MDMEIYFPGNKRVAADYKGFTVETDQPVRDGGDGSAPAPFDLFLVSLGTCAGIFVLQFLLKRGLSTEGAGLTMSMERDEETHMVSKATINIKLPADFPDKYKDAVVRAAELCSVKRHIEKPPAFEVYATIG